jgi:hypothetical protein
MKSYLSELIHDVDLLNQLSLVPTKKMPPDIKKAYKTIKKFSPVVHLTDGLLHAADCDPVSYVLKDRQAFYKSLPLPPITLQESNKLAFGKEAKFPDKLIVLNYESWVEKKNPAIMILVFLSNDLALCLNWFRFETKEQNFVHWYPASEPVHLSFGCPFNKRSDKEILSEKIFGDPHKLDDYDEHLLPGDDYNSGALLEVYTLLSSFLLMLNNKDTKIQKVIEGEDSYKVLIYKGHVC